MDKIIAISEAVKRDLVEKIGVSEKKVTKIYNGVDTEEFNPSVSGESFRKELNLGPVKLVGMVGRFTPEKGQDLFLRAAAKVIDEYRDVCFAVIGDAKLGSEQFKQAMINLSVELGLENKVIFTGFRDDLPRVMAALDIVVVSSVAEPFGRVIVEALAMEKGVVVSDSGAIPEIVSNDCGILVNPEDNEGFKEAILGLLTDTQRCKGLGESGRRIVEEKFGIKRHVSEMEGLYKKLGFFSMSDNCFMQKPTDYRVFNESYYKDSSAPVLADKETEQFQHREVARFASQGLNKGARILNIGCGVGLLSHRLSEYCERVISVDVSQYAVEKARSMYGDKKSWFTRANAEYLPFKSEIFDCVVASHLFTHLTDEQAKKAQKEIYRVTKKGGNLVVEQPLCGKKSIPDAALLLLFSSWKVKKYYCNSYKAIKRAKKDNSRADFHHLEGVGDPTHRRIYDPRLLIDELLKAGFKTFKFSRRKIFSILFFNRQDLFESYVKFYIKVPEIIRRLFLIDIGGRVKAIKDE